MSISKKRKDSDSSVQKKIESILVDEYENKTGYLGIHNTSKVWLNSSTYIVPDIYSEEQMIIGEVHAHMQKLKSAQKDKLASDILKMILFEKEKHTKYRKVILVCGKEEKAYLEGDSFVADAIRQFNIEVNYIGLMPEQEALLLNTAKKQDMSKS